jgi:thioredoxin reductase (NADPH)
METIAFDLQQTKRTPLSADHISALRRIGQVNHYAQWQLVTQAGQAMDRFIFIEEGEIEIVSPRTGERHLAHTLGPGQFAGEIAFLNGSSSSLTLRAAQPTRVIEVTREAMLALMANAPEMSDIIISVFAARRRRQLESGDSSLQLIGLDDSKEIRRIAEFASRNRIPFKNIELGSEEAMTMAKVCGIRAGEPAVVFGRDTLVAAPTVEKVATLLGLSLDI